MDPEQIGTFPATGSDGRTYTVVMLMTFRQIPQSPYDSSDPWVPAAFPEYTTPEGEGVSPYRGGTLRIAGSGVLLTPDGDALADCMTRHEARKRAVLGYPPLP